jgi:hypothetical protein
VQPLDEQRAIIGDTETATISQQRDALSTRHSLTRTRRSLGFRDQDIAIGKDMEPARMVVALSACSLA